MSELTELKINMNDLSRLSLNEVDALEQIINGPIESLDIANFATKPKAKLLKALAVLSLHKSAPKKWPISTSAQITAALEAVGELDMADLMSAQIAAAEEVPDPKGSKVTKND